MTTLHLTPAAALQRLVPHILEMESAARGQRIAIGIAGGPGVGKSTLAAELVTMLDAVHPGSAALVPMDGFHMKHAKLEAMGQTDYKGAPHTFEGAAFVSFLHHLKHATGPVSGPGYSRKIEDTVDDAFTVQPEARILIVEGNYLLLTEGPGPGSSRCSTIPSSSRCRAISSRRGSSSAMPRRGFSPRSATARTSPATTCPITTSSPPRRTAPTS